jgi:hypothetical protein
MGRLRRGGNRIASGRSGLVAADRNLLDAGGRSVVLLEPAALVSAIRRRGGSADTERLRPESEVTTMIVMTTESGHLSGRARRLAGSPAVAPAANRGIGSWRPTYAACSDLPNATVFAGEVGLTAAHLMATKPPARHLVTRST